MPASGAASTMRRTIAAPARCPAERERPCRTAHRPLPSMMMPTWIPELCSIKLLRKKREGLALARRADEGFHVRQIALERATAGRAQAVLGPWHPAFEHLAAGDVAR